MAKIGNSKIYRSDLANDYKTCLADDDNKRLFCCLNIEKASTRTFFKVSYWVNGTNSGGGESCIKFMHLDDAIRFYNQLGDELVSYSQLEEDDD